MIICLGWGSLIYKPESLAISGGWQEDGPSVSIEYLRQSKDGRLTLVIEPSAPELTVLWVYPVKAYETNPDIPYIKRGRSVRYEPEVLKQVIEQSRIGQVKTA